MGVETGSSGKFDEFSEVGKPHQRGSFEHKSRRRASRDAVRTGPGDGRQDKSERFPGVRTGYEPRPVKNPGLGEAIAETGAKGFCAEYGKPAEAPADTASLLRQSDEPQSDELGSSCQKAWLTGLSPLDRRRETLSEADRPRLARKIVQAAKWWSTKLAKMGVETPPHEVVGCSEAKFRRLDAEGEFGYWGFPTDRPGLVELVRQYAWLDGEKRPRPSNEGLGTDAVELMKGAGDTAEVHGVGRPEPGLGEAIIETGAKVIGSGLLLSAGCPPVITEMFVDKLYDKMVGDEDGDKLPLRPHHEKPVPSLYDAYYKEPGPSLPDYYYRRDVYQAHEKPLRRDLDVPEIGM